MRVVIYVDILVLLNMLINFFLIKTTTYLCQCRPKTWRILLCSGVSGLFSLIIFLPQQPLYVEFGIKLLLAAAITLMLFGFQNKKAFAFRLFVFFTVNVVYAGAMLAIWLCLKPSFMVMQNGVLYLPLSPITLVVSCVFCYGAISLFEILTRKKKPAQNEFLAHVLLNGRQTVLRAFWDSGNQLIDLFSNLPVVVCHYQALLPLLDAPVKALVQSLQQDPQCFLKQGFCLPKGVKVIPYHMLGEESLLVCVAPQKLWLEGNGALYDTQDVLLGLCPNPIFNGRYDLLLNEHLALQPREEGVPCLR